MGSYPHFAASKLRTARTICFDKECFDLSYYQSYDIDQVIQSWRGTLTAIAVGDILGADVKEMGVASIDEGPEDLTVQAPGAHYHDIVLTEGLLHCPILFTDLVSASSLWKKGWYYQGGTETLNRYDDDFQLASNLIRKKSFRFSNFSPPSDVTRL